ncbi:MAG: SagB/ThcOx family dehydrogenase [Betaproteobacteria bacterium]|nr:SagB/ThcOx family dehydrogenase [Betaproteobacteria bacterium]
MTKEDPVGAADAFDPLEVVMRYHQETKHHFSRHARALGYMDWANQPDPFRRYEGSALIPLPVLGPDDAPLSPFYEDMYHPGAIVSAPVTIRTLSRFLEFSLAISAWKQAGEVRWALRTNPSSGNLHPTEGYLLIGKVAGLSPAPGLYHYTAMEHALELRAEVPTESFDSLLQGFTSNAFFVGFSSVNWRETWKYGERAFRYCQHDVGHAIGSARIAAQTLGWRTLLLDGLADDTLAALLGVDRPEDFEGAEREHPDCLAVVWPADQEAGRSTGKTISLPLFVSTDAVRDSARRIWHGKANRLSRDDPVKWQILDQVEAASWKSSTEQRLVELNQDGSSAETPTNPSTHAPGIYPGQPRAGQVIRQRRSALAFDGKTSISVGTFFTMLARVMPRVEREPCRRPMPWDVLPWEPAIHLVLFVHRVNGVAPGLYMLVRDPAKVDSLRRAMHRQFAWTLPPGCPENLPLFLLDEGDARQLAAQLSCRQEIAGDSAFSLGMIAEFEPSLRRYGPWFYRRLFWEAGVIGQVLYLEAEASGVRATGIGCFFDDPVHQLLGFNDATFQSLYHFTTGGPVEDLRVTTLPPYRLDRREPGN